MSQADVELARRGFEAVARGDLEEIAALLDPQVRWHGGDPDAEGACRNRDEALAFMGAAQRQRRIGRLLEVIDAGDSVVVVMQPQPVDGQTPPPRANLTTFRNGRVVEMIAFESPEAALAHARAAGGQPDTRD